MREAITICSALLLAAAVLSAPRPGRASKPSAESGRAEAELLMRRAGKLAEQGLFVEAAEAYLAIERDFERACDPRTVCRVLDLAGANLDAANLVGRAIEVRERLLEHFPRCELAASAVLRLARDYEELALYDRAAERYVEFASMSPYSPEAPGAALKAIALFVGAEDPVRAQLVLPLYEKLIRKVTQHEAAAAVFDALELLVETGDLDFVRSHYSRFLERYERVAAPDSVVLAHVRVADTWLQDERPNAREAQRHYRTAARIFAGVALDKVADPSRRSRLLDAAARARYEIALVAARRLDALGPPRLTLRPRLRAEIRKWWASEERPLEADDVEIQLRYWLAHVFEPWHEAKRLLLDEAVRRLEAVSEIGVPGWVVRAEARIADARLSFARALMAAEPPAEVAADSRLERIFRVAAGARTEPLMTAAVAAYGRCLAIAIEQRAFGAESRHCEQRLAELRPTAPERDDEIGPRVDLDSPSLNAPGPILVHPDEEAPAPLLLIVTPTTIDTLDPLGGLELP